METPSQISQFAIPPGFIDLGLGDPQYALLPLEIMRQAAEERLSQNDPEFLQYGAKQGDGLFRKTLAKFLSSGYGFPTEPDSLFITNGASMGLHLICTLFTQPGDTIFVEEPTYFFSLRIFADHGLHLIPIRTDESGLVIESLEEELGNFHPKFLYIIPTYQNPTSHTLSQERREQLVSLSRQHDFLLVADEVYHFLTYSGKPPKPFAAHIEAAKVISVGSFSKILAPGFRLGYIAAPKDKIHQLISLQKYVLSSPSTLSQKLVYEILKENYRSIKKEINTHYRKKMETLLKSLNSNGLSKYYHLPRGGFYVWLRTQKKFNESIKKQLLDSDVNVVDGRIYFTNKPKENYIRLSIANIANDEINQAVKVIKKILYE